MFVALSMGQGFLKADTFAPPYQVVSTGTNPVDLEFRASGVFIAKGNDGVGSLLSGDQSSGTTLRTLLLWYPGKAAFRAGKVDGTYWDESSIGEASIAFGYNTKALGSSSSAFGYGTIASADSATAFGGFTEASGANSTTFGFHSIASGDTSLASGNYTTALGDCVSVFGFHTTATAYASTVIGRYNLTTNSSTAGKTTWVDAEPLFQVGNGTSAGTGASDAFTVYKNGKATVKSTITAPTFVTTAPAGDIPMFGN